MNPARAATQAYRWRVGERLKAQRVRHQMTRDDVADRLAVTMDSVGDWERGSRTPQLERQWQIADLFGVHPAALFCWRDVACEKGDE